MRLFKACLLLMLISSCDSRDIVYQKKSELPESGWRYRDTLNYTFEIKDTTRLYNLYLELKHTTAYPYQNIYFNIHTRFPSGERLKKLVDIELADATGAWNGNCRSNTCSWEVPIQQDAFFNQAGTYTLTLEQFLRTDTLSGVEALTFTLEDTGRKKGEAKK